jgi:hypothetical protein
MRRHSRGRFVPTAATLVILAGRLAHAQDDPAQIVIAQERQSAALAASWLASDDPRVRAWGPYLALRDHHQELVPQLAALAEGHAVRPLPGRAEPAFSRSDWVEHNATLSVLDALVQLNASLPAATAAALLPEFPAQSLIFLARGGVASNGQLLDIFGRTNVSIGAWLAAGDLLVNQRAQKPAGVAATLLKELTVHLRLEVVDPGARPAPDEGTGASCSGGVGGLDPGWPTVGNYYLTTSGVLLASGVDPVYYQRAVGPPDRSGGLVGDVCSAWGSVIFYNRDGLRQRFLAVLAGEWADAPTARASTERTVTWTSQVAYLADVRGIIHEEEQLLDALSSKLLDLGLLSAGERATVQPTVEVRIADARRQRSSPLPDVPGLPNNVEIVK